MHTKTRRRHLLMLALAVVAVSLWMAPIGAQKKTQLSPGLSHGEMDFPISWKRYYSTAEKLKIMQGLQKQYPPARRPLHHRQEPDGPRPVDAHHHHEVHRSRRHEARACGWTARSTGTR